MRKLSEERGPRGGEGQVTVFRTKKRSKSITSDFVCQHFFDENEVIGALAAKH